MADPMTWVEAPAREPRPNTSLDVIPVHDVPSAHFTGFQYQVDPCVFPADVPQDCYVQVGPAAGTQKAFNAAPANLTTQVFGLYGGVECYLNGGIDEFAGMSQRILSNGEYKGVDSALATMLAAIDVPLAASTTITGAVGVLENALANNVPGQGYIFMSPAHATAAVNANLLIRNLDGTLETYLGTKVVIVSAMAGVSAVYASGQPHLWRSAIETHQAPEVTLNTARALSERLYSLGIECGAWSTALTAPTTGTPLPAPLPMELELGTTPASPIPVNTDVTALVQTSVMPTAEVFLHYRINGGPVLELGEMTEIGTLAFVYNLAGGTLGVSPGDTVEAWATTEYNGTTAESNHILVEVIA